VTVTTIDLEGARVRIDQLLAAEVAAGGTARARMSTPVPVAAGVGYGFALGTRTLGDRRLLGHNGGMVGYVSTLQVEPDAGVGVVVLMNGPGSPMGLARAILDAVRDDTPTVSGEHASSEAAAGLAGPDVEVEGSRTFTLAVAAGGLRFTSTTSPEPADIETWDDDLYLVAAPAWDRFLLWVERSATGPTVLWHGEARFVATGATPPALPTPEGALLSHRGTYRSHDPWLPVFRIVLRGDRLWLQFPATPNGGDPEQPLSPIDDGWFRLGEDEGGPERIRFDLPIDGLSRRAWLGTWPWSRVAD
jgi:hypothetical protein